MSIWDFLPWILVLAIIGLALYVLYNYVTTGKFPTLESIGGISSIIAVLAFMYAIFNGEATRVTDYVLRSVDVVDKMWENVQTNVREMFPASWKIFREIQPDVKLPINPISNRSNDDADLSSSLSEPLADVIISEQLCQNIQNFLHLNHHAEFDFTDTPYIIMFLQWFQSPTLVKMWDSISFHYECITINFIKKIIRGSARIAEVRKTREITREDYAIVARDILAQREEYCNEQ